MNDLDEMLDYKISDVTAVSNGKKKTKIIDWDRWFPFNLECIDSIITMSRNSSSSIVIFLYICSIMDRKRNCMVTTKRELCRELYLDIKTVSRALNTLCEYKFISIDRKGNSMLIFVNPYAVKKTSTSTVLKYGGFAGGICSIPDGEKYVINVPKESISSGFVTKVRNTIAKLVKERFNNG